MGTNAAGSMPSQQQVSSKRRDVQVMLPGGNQMLVDSTLPVDLAFTQGDVNSYNRQFEEILDQLRAEVQNDGWDLSGNDHNYLQELSVVGSAAYQSLWPQLARERTAELEDEEGERGLRFTFYSRPEYAFFWEMLYAGAPYPFGAIDPDQFWGFRYPLGRFFIGNFRQRTQVHLHNGLLSAIHLGLEHSQAEVAAIKELLGMLPHAPDQEFLIGLLDQLIPEAEYEPMELLGQLITKFHAADFPYGIIHFACHADNPAEAGAVEATLGFSIHEQDLWISLQQLIGYKERGFQREPFVFLNACGSATLGHLLESSNFPAGFLSFGAASVIATACTVPDNFAGAFSREFYRRLFDPGRKAPIFFGDVLWETRHHFLTEYNNPLGLAYGLYGVSNQEFRYT